MHSDFFDDLESWSCEQSNDLERTDSNRKEAKNTKLLKPVDVKRTPETKERPFFSNSISYFFPTCSPLINIQTFPEIRDRTYLIL